jgi:hypothetical protein
MFFCKRSSISPFQIVSFRVYSRGPTFLPPIKPTVLDLHVGRSAIVPTFPRTLWKQRPCPLHFILRNKRKSHVPHVRWARRLNDQSWAQFSMCYSYTRNSHTSPPLSYQQCTSWHLKHKSNQQWCFSSFDTMENFLKIQVLQNFTRTTVTAKFTSFLLLMIAFPPHCCVRDV